MFFDALTFLFASVLLWFAADWIVDAAAAIARRFHVPELVIGLTVVAMGTSAPEFLVTITAALRGIPDISLSNVVGSNVFNLGIILGLVAMMRPIASTPALVKRDGLLLLVVTGLITLFALDHTLGRVEGLVLVAILVGYLSFLIIRKPGDLVLEETEQREATWTDSIKLLAGFAGVAVGGSLMVDSATNIALSLGVSTWVIGVTIVAAGTSLPELVTCLAASLRGKNDMLLGNLIGSDLFNFAGVLGLTCALRPLSISADAMPSLYMLVGAIALVLLAIRTGWRVTRLEGALLFALGIARWLPSLL